MSNDDLKPHQKELLDALMEIDPSELKDRINRMVRGHNKPHLMDQLLKISMRNMHYGTTVTGRLKPDIMIIDDECHDLKTFYKDWHIGMETSFNPIEIYMPPRPAKEIPDWKHPIPNTDPATRPVSCPDSKTRAKLRAKRKKRK